MTKQKPSKIEVVQGGKYAKLYQHLINRNNSEWVTTFDGIEKVLGCALPNGSKSNRAFWANGSRTHSMAWTLAGSRQSRSRGSNTRRATRQNRSFAHAEQLSTVWKPVRTALSDYRNASHHRRSGIVSYFEAEEQ